MSEGPDIVPEENSPSLGSQVLTSNLRTSEEK